MLPQKPLAESYQLFFKNLFNFNGRTRRSDYWRVILINAVVAGVASGIIGGIFGGLTAVAYNNYAYTAGSVLSAISSIITSLISLAVFVLELGITIRRLHDVGKDWTYYLLGLIPIVGGIIVFIALVGDSQPGDNQFGPNPKGVSAPAYQAPAQGYAPQQNYGYAQQQPAQPYAAPQQPAQQYAAPQQPAQQYAAPQQPAQPYAAPQQPAQQYAAPQPAQPAQPAAPAQPAPASAPTYCSSCGSPVPLGSANCPNCGAQVK